MTPLQRQIADEIASTRTTGLAGPFAPWLANPAIADAAQKLGRICRYETCFPLRQSEMLILMTAACFEAQTEWDIHVGEARKAGLEETTIEALAKRQQPNFGAVASTEAGKDDASGDCVLWRFADELLRNQGHVSDVAYTAMQQRFGERGLVDATAITGYYVLVAYTLNLFHIVDPSKRRTPS